MNPDLRQSMVRHEGCWKAGLCIRCIRPLMWTSVKCPKCNIFSYCSYGCLEKDIPRHQSVCDMFNYVNLNVASAIRNAENDGEPIRFSSREVLESYIREQKQESSVSMNSDDMNSLTDHDTQSSASTDCQITDSSQCNSTRVSDSEQKAPDTFGRGWWGKNKDSSKKLKQENRSKHVSLNDTILGEENEADKSTSICSIRSHSAGSNSACVHSARIQSADSHNANSHDAITNREDLSSVSNPIANRRDINSASNTITNREDINSASNPITNRENINSVSNPITNKEDINSASKPITNRENINSASNPITNRENTNSASNPITNRENINSASNPITNREDINSASKPITNRENINSTSKPIADIPNRGSPNMKASKSGNGDLDASKSNCNPTSSQSSKTTDRESFGSGWWQVKKPRKLNTPSSSTNQQALLNPDNSESKHERQNRVRNTNSSNSAPNKETSKNSNRTTASTETKQQSDSSDFGSGWWKHRFVNNNTRKTNTTESTKNSIPTKRNKPEEAKYLSSNRTPEFVNKCTDIVPYTFQVSLGQMFKFYKVKSCFDSEVVSEEAMHGRVLMMVLDCVPGVAKASLGGSRISLVVEIVGRYPSAMLGILVRDKFGHQAPVLINIESSMYTVPSTDIQIPYSDCIKPGNFIILRAVYWEQLPSGKLAIVMRDIKNVNFLFYDLIA